MVEPRRARDVDAAMDRVDPGRAGIGHDDAGGAEDRQAADDAEPAVERSLGDLLRRRESRSRPRRRPPRRRARRLRRSPPRIIRRGAGLMAGSPGGSGSPGRVTVPTPGAGAKRDARMPARRARTSRDHQRAMGHVGIVARVLDDPGRARNPEPCSRQASAKDGRSPRGQGHLDRIRKFAGQKRRIGRLAPPRRRRCRWSSPGGAGDRVWS